MYALFVRHIVVVSPLLIRFSGEIMKIRLFPWPALPGMAGGEIPDAPGRVPPVGIGAARWRVSLFFLLLLMTIAAKSAEHRWVLSLPWVPQAQFAGIYWAKEKGLFNRQGLQVELRHRTAETPIFDALKSPESDLVIAPLVTALKARDAGLEVVNLAQISQESSLLLVARSNSGLTDLRNFRLPDRRARVGIWSVNFDVLPRIFLSRNKLDVEVFPVNDGVGLFLWGALDAVTAMEYNEFYQLLAAGLRPEELIRYRLRDYGLNVPEDGLYALEETFRRYPEDCEALRNALISGWQEALRQPAEALELVREECERHHCRYDPAQQKWMLYAFGQNLKTDDQKVCGRLSRHNYDVAVQLLKKYGEIQNAAPFETFFPLSPAPEEGELNR